MAFYASIQYNRKRRTDESYSTENSRNCFEPFSVSIRVCGEKNDETCRTHAKRYLHSVFLQIHTDYVTFLLKKRFLRKECKEHSIVCISALMIINKIVLVVH